MNSSERAEFPDIQVVRVVQVEEEVRVVGRLAGAGSQSLDGDRARNTCRQRQATNPRPMAYHSYQLPLRSL
ncbi:unannotated protein [freshwater metagenome]|uniref:Unannotated protein n=1 Tax=freshwater metagenome TaxID=449393 RepID=A0A6J7USX1_9ZZZZ